MRNYEGDIIIEGVDFWCWVIKNYLPDCGDEVLFGIPEWDKETKTMRVEYAGSNECSPASWAKKPSFIRRDEDAKQVQETGVFVESDRRCPYCGNSLLNGLGTRCRVCGDV